jgi:hypothetical protein
MKRYNLDLEITPGRDGKAYYKVAQFLAKQARDEYPLYPFHFLGLF